MALKESAENVSMHGFARIAITQQKALKVVWLTLVLGALCMLGIQIKYIVSNFISYPSATNSKTVIATSMPFPAVTFCSSLASRNKLAMLNFSNLDQNLDEDLLNKNMFDSRMERQAMFFLRIRSKESLKNVSVDGSSLFLSNVSGSCLFGIEDTCNYPRDFKDTLTISRGFCHTFNHDGKSKQVRSGTDYGMSLIVFLNVSDSVPWTDKVVGDAIEILVHDHKQFPFPASGSILAPVGAFTQIQLRKRMKTRKRRPFRSNCTNGENIRLLFPGAYSVRNCQESCYAWKMAEKCNSVEFYLNMFLPKHLQMPPPNTTKAADCIYGVFDELEESAFKSCGCELPCHETDFLTPVFYSKWPAQSDMRYYKFIFSQALGLDAATVTDDYIRSNFARINLFYSDMSYEEIREKGSYTWDYMVSDMGGQMGVWIGASVFSMAELIYLSVQLVHYFFTKKRISSTELSLQPTGH